MVSIDAIRELRRIAVGCEKNLRNNKKGVDLECLTEAVEIIFGLIDQLSRAIQVEIMGKEDIPA